jgi:MoaA/NifB/PqqE/SkfB family radical SAM enzyme
MPPPPHFYLRLRNKLSSRITEIFGRKFVLRKEHEAHLSALREEFRTEILQIVSREEHEAQLAALRGQLRAEHLKTVPLAYIQFDYHIVEHCNFSCVGCTYFAPLAEEEYIDVDIFEKDMRRMAELTNNESRYIQLIGGDPLLHPQLLKINEIARRYFPATRIALFTNGLLLLRQDDKFWRNMRENKIVIFPSHYPGVDYESIKNKAAECGVAFEFAWIWEKENVRTMNSKDILDIEGTQDYRRSFIYCDRPNACITLKNGKLYTCPIIPTAYHFNKYFNRHLEVTERDYIDIYRAKDINEILSFLSRPVPFCRYCNIPGRKISAIPFQASKKDISEWT